jgi:hypothetical protein
MALIRSRRVFGISPVRALATSSFVVFEKYPRKEQKLNEKGKKKAGRRSLKKKK